MTRSTEWLSKWIFWIAASLYFLAVVLRTWLRFQDEPELIPALVLLCVWALLFASEQFLSQRWKFYFPLYLIFQTILVFASMSLPGTPDYFGTLLGVLSMQVLMRLPPRSGAFWIGLCAIFMVWILFPEYESQAIALALIYTASNIFLGSYMLTLRRGQKVLRENQNLAVEIETANQRLQEYAAQVEKLAAARERNRLARDLHDSVTQTVFSMNLTTQSAALLLQRDPAQAGEQLERLYALSRSALAEMQILISELKPDPTSNKGLPAALSELLTDSHFAGKLRVTIEEQGNLPLLPAEEHSLLRIAQEALNNILKHACVSEAQIRLHLEMPCWMEIEDHGQGFDPQQQRSRNQVGLAGMQERAAEIGWELQIFSSPGTGTRIRITSKVENLGQEGGQDGFSRVEDQSPDR